MKNKMILGMLLAVVMVLSAVGVFAADPASPPGCNADNSVVNIARSTAGAQPGQTITFTVSAGNPDSLDGCDISERVMTLTLPDGSTHVFGPTSYLNPSAVTFVGSADYVADPSDAVGGIWTATVEWTGTQKDGFDSASNGDKETSVNYVPVNLEVSKTAVPAIETGYEWTIEKSVDPTVAHLFIGESADFDYEVEVTKTQEGSVYSVSGEIEIYNPSAFVSAEGVVVVDSIEGVGPVSVVCPASTIAPLGTMTCTYSSSLPDATERLNTATVTSTGVIGGGEGTATINFDQVAPEATGYGKVNVEDTNGMSWQASDSATWTYTETFTCSRDPSMYTNGHYMFTHVNTAEIVETGQSDSETVTVHCYDITVSKTADTTYDTSCDWTIEKTGSVSELLLNPGQTYIVDYVVSVSPDCVDENWAVSGDITITNNHPTEDALLTDVSDSLAAVDCGLEPDQDLIVPAGDSIVCTYSGALQSGDSTTNTATVDFNGVDHVATAPVTFGDPVNVIDECVLVTDTHAEGPQGETVCVGKDGTFEYSFELMYETCLEEGVYEHLNTASFVAGDTGANGEASWTVIVDVPCPEGCTLTQGYWKTHSDMGKAPYDENWGLIGDFDGDSVEEEEGEDFYLSGQTWYQVFWTPVGGNAYYQLAHQYMAAKLNVLVGASVPDDVAAAMEAAEALFGEKTPADVVGMTGGKLNKQGKLVGATKTVNKELAAQFTGLAGTLGSYNEGLIGPGHCDEDYTSAPY